MKDIQTRDDVSLLVSSFYNQIRKDKVLGPIFNGHIPNEKWPQHINKLTDFWMTGLFGIISFKGNPTEVHKTVDRNLKYSLTQNHFDLWLSLWFTTIDSLFQGDLAERAKIAAKKMAQGQFKSIQKVRPETINI